MGALAIVLAGGSGSRMGLDRNKVYVPLAGRPVLEWSLSTLARSPLVEHIVLVHRAEDTGEVAAVLDGAATDKVRAAVVGGASRTGSELAGIAEMRRLIERRAMSLDDVVMIHDGARPFLTLDLIGELIETAARLGGAVPGFIPPAPIGRLSADGGRLTPLPADALRRVQTPQCFRAGALITAYEAAGAAGFDGVDTAEIVQHFGPQGDRIGVVDCDLRNIKITVADDLDRAHRFAAEWTFETWAPPSGGSMARHLDDLFLRPPKSSGSSQRTSSMLRRRPRRSPSA